MKILPASETHSLTSPTVPQSIRDNAQKPGTATFIGPDQKEDIFSFAELSAAVDKRGVALLASGLQKGDRVGFVLLDSKDFVISFLGALAVGVIPVPMYPPLSLGRLDSYLDTAARILGAGRARALLTDKKAQGILWTLLDRVESLESLLLVEDLNATTSEEVPDLDAISLDDTAFLQFTSGSTSTPKGVIVTHRSLVANLYVGMYYGLQVTPEDVTISWLPLYHDMGLIGFVLGPLWYSISAVFLPTLSFIRHPSRWMETVSKYKGTITFAPNFAYALATRRTPASKLEKLDLSTLKAVGCGAEPNHPGTLAAFVEHFSKAGLKPGAMLPCYGMAEATLAVSFSPLHRGIRTDRIDQVTYHDKWIAKPIKENGKNEGVMELVSCGVPFPDHQILIFDEAGKQLPERRVGEIVLRGPSNTSGYFACPDVTKEVFGEDGLHTGDLGYLAEGELFVTGRKKDLIIINGRNYDPQSVEWEVAEVEGVRKGNVVAFSRPGEQSEELVVVAEIKGTETPQRIESSIRIQIHEALFLSVADIILLGPGQLPKTSSGKLQRARTREMYLSGSLGDEVRTPGSRGQALIMAKHFSLSLMARIRHTIRRHVPFLWFGN